MFDSIDSKTVHVGLAHPITVGLDEGIDYLRSDRVIVGRIILQRIDVSMLPLRVPVIPVLRDLALSVVTLGVPQIVRDRPVGAPPGSEVKALIVRIVVGKVARIAPVIARVIDDYVENDSHRPRLTVERERMRGIDEIDQVLLGAEVRIYVEVVVDVVSVIGIRVVLENRREPDSRAPKPAM